MSGFSIEPPLILSPLNTVRRHPAIASWLLRLVAAGLTMWAVVGGWSLRQSLWAASQPIRFRGDIANGLQQGRSVVSDACVLSGATAKSLSWPQFLAGFRQRYDRVLSQGRDQRFSLDYTPARLLVMSVWAWHVERTYPNVRWYRDEYAEPLLRFNAICTLLSSMFMFLLVRHWVRRDRLAASGRAASGGATSGEPFGNVAPGDRPWIIALIAAAMVWFNPAILADAQMWPQWDVWLLPGYLAAVWLASIDWWFCAGLCIAIAAMFKGQVLMVSPALVLWPMFGGRWDAALRLVIGLGAGVAMLASCWLLPAADAWLWIAAVAAVVISCLLAGRRTRWRQRWAWPAWGMLPLAAVIARPLVGSTFNREAGIFIALVLITPLIAPLLNRLSCTIWLAAITAWAVFIGCSAFGGSWSWFIVGFIFPTYHYLDLSRSCSNLAQILGTRYHWGLEEHVLSIPRMFSASAYGVTLKTLLIAIYSITLICCAIGAAVQCRRNSVRVLAALGAPWICMFAFLPQMHERYLIWGAAAGSMLAGVSLGAALLQLVIISLATISIYTSMLWQDISFSPKLLQALNATNPGIGWALIAIALVYLYLAIAPPPRRTTQPIRRANQ